MSAKQPTPRALAAIAELEQAASRMRSTTAPTATARAVVGVLDATATYWQLWFPRDPTGIDRAALALARAILSEAPDAAAGSLPHFIAPTEKGAPS